MEIKKCANLQQERDNNNIGPSLYSGVARAIVLYSYKPPSNNKDSLESRPSLARARKNGGKARGPGTVPKTWVMLSDMLIVKTLQVYLGLPLYFLMKAHPTRNANTEAMSVWSPRKETVDAAIAFSKEKCGCAHMVTWN